MLICNDMADLSLERHIEANLKGYSKVVHYGLQGPEPRLLKMSAMLQSKTCPANIHSPTSSASHLTFVFI